MTRSSTIPSLPTKSEPQSEINQLILIYQGLFVFLYEGINITLKRGIYLRIKRASDEHFCPPNCIVYCHVQLRVLHHKAAQKVIETEKNLENNTYRNGYTKLKVHASWFPSLHHYSAVYLPSILQEGTSSQISRRQQI